MYVHVYLTFFVVPVQREELLDTLASRLYRVGLGEEVEEEEEDEQEKKGELGMSLTQKQLQKASCRAVCSGLCLYWHATMFVRVPKKMPAQHFNINKHYTRIHVL